jgi:uncharacterized protein with FMN-binding domain
MDKKQTEQSKKLIASLALLILTVVIVGSVIISRPKSSDSTSQSAKSSSTNNVAIQSSSTSTSQSNSGYKNGSYSATGKYNSPGGNETVKVSLTLNNNIVTASDVEAGANDPTALSYQTIFIGGYKQYVVGKKINSIDLHNVSGSSLTSQGFNDALKQIERQAQA